jgi:hypothetical protein
MHTRHRVISVGCDRVDAFTQNDRVRALGIVAPLVDTLKAGSMAILSLSFGKASLEQFFLSRTENEAGSQDE